MSGHTGSSLWEFTQYAGKLPRVSSLKACMQLQTDGGRGSILLFFKDVFVRVHTCVHMCVCECVFHTCIGEKTICRHWIYQAHPEDPAWVLIESSALSCQPILWPLRPSLKGIHIVCTVPFRMKELPMK